jgi:hypothetical protein
MNPPSAELFVGQRLLAILAAHEGPDVRRRDSATAVWDLSHPGLVARRRRQRRAAVEACRGELLGTLLGGEPVFLLNPESPREWDVPGDWRPAGASTWLVPPGFDPHEPATQRWLFTIGDWCFYLAASAVEEGWPDVFRCSAATLQAWMREKWMQALIASFHDDAEWVVAVGAA